MDKQQALARLKSLETETAELRRIIEAPEKLPGLWKPGSENSGRDYSYVGIGGGGEVKIPQELIRKWRQDYRNLSLSAALSQQSGPSSEPEFIAVLA